MSGEGTEDLRIPPEALTLITQGINGALSELEELGLVGQAGMGRGFGSMAMGGLELGDDGLTETFRSFCERWEWGVRALVQEGNDFALRAGLSAGIVYREDQYVQGGFKVLANSAMGNPHATEDEVTGMSWGDLADHTMYAHADFSAESFQKADADIKQSVKDAGRDMSDSKLTPFGLSLSVAGSATGQDEAVDQWRDREFGPSPEARAEQRARNGGDKG
ncbi:hypothetical protein N4G70_10345 [Streptomyces sp. ASQP_92]|uniref:hypothetical protein n=1 Tax=Streptomyces sp. ASQP_92 TaxID=2979116 RepID=UPI0021C1AF95|nr:hypothetical protein [Streptomyces sp. ASQP_92]MCT9089267.1 hypothetical protein [Streptomyces sp. ASQP_92]